jgi:hypothetical protein
MATLTITLQITVQSDDEIETEGLVERLREEIIDSISSIPADVTDVEVVALPAA